MIKVRNIIVQSRLVYDIVVEINRILVLTKGIVMSITSKQRRERILAQVLEKRHVTARDLAQTTEASEATVRRDLKAMAQEGQLDLVYGGATMSRVTDYSFRSKGMRNIEAKRVIGKLAADLVKNGDQIFLDSGTTCFEMAPFLKSRKSLTVIVNSARLALELDSPGMNVILVGGQYRPDRMDTVGPLSAATLEQLRGYTAFVGADGLSRDFGLAAADIDSAHFNRLALLRARQTILVADFSKFQTPSLYKIVGWESIKAVVTDGVPPEEWVEFLKNMGIELVMPKSQFSVSLEDVSDHVQ